MKCIYHLCSNELTGSQIKYCSESCKDKTHVKAFRQKIKQKAVEYKGGHCQICHYNKCVEALCFHHRDPKEKDFSISYKGYCRKWETVKKELDKCDILCANCHAEKHANLLK